MYVVYVMRVMYVMYVMHDSVGTYIARLTCSQDHTMTLGCAW